MAAPDGTDAAGADGAAARPRPRRVRRIVGWSVLSLLLASAVLVVIVTGALSRLDNPTIAGLLRDRLATGYDVEISYDALSVDVLTGVHAENLRLHTPPPYTAHAPDLLHIGRLDASWDVWSLMRGEPRLGKIEVQGVTLRVVVDEHGGSSLIELARRFPPADEPEEPAVPLSHLLQDALPALAVDALSVRDAGVELVELQLINTTPSPAQTDLAFACDD